MQNASLFYFGSKQTLVKHEGEKERDGAGPVPDHAIGKANRKEWVEGGLEILICGQSGPQNGGMSSLGTYLPGFRLPFRSPVGLRVILSVSLCALAFILFSEGAFADHPIPPSGSYADNNDETSNPGVAGTSSDWDVVREESCSYNNHHSGYDAAGNRLNGHGAIELLNQDHGEEDDFPLVVRLKNGGVEVKPIFNCLPNFWGWILYRLDGGNRVPVVDQKANDRWVSSPDSFREDTVSHHLFPKPQHERSTFGNTVAYPQSAELMRGVGYGLGTSTPSLLPQGGDDDDKHIVFKYNSSWYNGEGRIDAIVPIINLQKNSVDNKEPLFVKVWTAEAIEKLAAPVDQGLGEYNPFGLPTDKVFKNVRVWPHENSPTERAGYSVGGYTSNSIWDRIARRLNPIVWLDSLTRPAGLAAMNVACGIWARAVNVYSDGCETHHDFVSHVDGSDYWLANGSPGVTPMMTVDADGKHTRARGYGDVDPDREVYFTRRMMTDASAVSGSAPIVARLSERGYPVQVAAPSAQGLTWRQQVPSIVEIEMSPPLYGGNQYVKGETVHIKVRFSEPVAFLPWEPDSATPNFSDEMARAASFQLPENLRMRLVGMAGACELGSDYVKRKCMSAKYDVYSNGTGANEDSTWAFVYKIPDNARTETGHGFAVAVDNGGQFIGTGGAALTTPFWFEYDAWFLQSSGVNLDQYFQVGANFAGADRPFDTTSQSVVSNFTLDSLDKLVTHQNADIHLSDNYAFGTYNTISDESITTILTHRKYARDLLSFTGLIKGTPAAATYERGYVVLGWTVMMNLVFALFVLFIAWAAVTSIVRPLISNNDGGSGWKEMAPRIVIAAIAAGSSFWWCKLTIDLADGISRYVAEALRVNPGDVLHIGLSVYQIMVAPAASLNVGTTLTSSQTLMFMLAIIVVLMFYLVLGLLVLGQLILRIVMLNLLMIIAPIGMSMFILPDTEGWGKTWVRQWMITLFRHALQLVGFGLALSFVRNTIPIGNEVVGHMDVLWALIMGSFALYLTWKLPSMLGDGGVSEGFLSTMTMVTNMLAHLPQAMRTGVNLAGAYMTGGVGGMAMTAMGVSSSAMSAFGMHSVIPSSSGSTPKGSSGP